MARQFDTATAAREFFSLDSTRMAEALNHLIAQSPPEPKSRDFDIRIDLFACPNRQDVALTMRAHCLRVAKMLVDENQAVAVASVEWVMDPMDPSVTSKLRVRFMDWPSSTAPNPLPQHKQAQVPPSQSIAP